MCCEKYQSLYYFRSNQMPWTDQIKEIAPHVRTYFWVTISCKYHGAEPQWMICNSLLLYIENHTGETRGGIGFISSAVIPSYLYSIRLKTINLSGLKEWSSSMNLFVLHSGTHSVAHSLSGEKVFIFWPKTLCFSPLVQRAEILNVQEVLYNFYATLIM